MRGKDHENLSEVPAGELAAVAKLTESATGDTLAPKGTPVVVAGIEPPEPVLSIAIVPRTKGDEDKLMTALHRLQEEDPALQIRRDDETHQTLLSGMGETHLSIVTERLHRKSFPPPQAATPKVRGVTTRQSFSNRGRVGSAMGGTLPPSSRGAGSTKTALPDPRMGILGLGELESETPTDDFGFGVAAWPRCRELPAPGARSVGFAQEAPKPELRALPHGMSRHGRLAVPTDGGENAPFGENAKSRFRVRHAGEKNGHRLVARAMLDRECPLPDRGQTARGVEHLGRHVGQAQTDQARPSEDDGVDGALAALSETRIDVAAKGHDLEVGPLFEQLHPATQRRRADAAARRKLGERLTALRDQDVARVFACGNAADDEPGRELGWNVFHRVHGDVRAPREQGLLDLLDEQALAADLSEGPILHAIARRLHRELLDRKLGIEPGQGGHERARLREGELASARGVDEASHRREPPVMLIGGTPVPPE
jgi:hypothetical protein